MWKREKFEEQCNERLSVRGNNRQTFRKPSSTMVSSQVLNSFLVCLLCKAQVRIFNYLQRMFYGLTIKCFETVDYLINANETCQRIWCYLFTEHVLLFHQLYRTALGLVTYRDQFLNCIITLVSSSKYSNHHVLIIKSWVFNHSCRVNSESVCYDQREGNLPKALGLAGNHQGRISLWVVTETL